MLFTYLEEILLLSAILIGIIISSTLKTNKNIINDILYQKKVFYLFLRCFIIIFFLCFVNTGLMLIDHCSDIEAIFDPATTYNVHQNNQVFSAAFIRKDLFSLFLNLILGLSILFYTGLVYETQKQTTTQTKYFLEIPLLLATIFLSLKIFLYTYDLLLIVVTLELTAFCSLILLSLQMNATSTTVFPFEAAIKYFIFNAIAISLFLFAICGYYSVFKTVNLLDIALFSLFEPAVVYEHLETIVLLQLFFFFSYFIKLGAAPFHQWVPDVYEGVELLVTSFLVLIISPVLVFKLFAFTKLLLPLFDSHNPIFFLFSVCGLLSIILGTFHAFSQTRIKRFLAYTGITHLGYILLSLGTSSFLGFFAGFFYLFFYIITNMVLFSLLLLMRKISGVSLIFLSHLKILLNDNVMLFVFFLIPLLSFAGFPPFAGFFSKLFMLGALVDRESILFLILLVFYIVLSAYLYLRFIKIALFEKKSFHGFFPIKAFKAGRDQNQNFPVYYRIETTLSSYKKTGESLELHNNFFGILYGLNFSLFFVLSMLPLVCLLLQQPLLALFLFY